MTQVALAKIAVSDAIEQLLDPSGRTLEVVKVANSSLFALRWKEGGSLPSTGEHKLDTAKWTKPDMAIEAARAYLADRWKMSEDAKSAPKNKPTTEKVATE